MILAVGVVYIGIIALEVPHMVSGKLWRELFTFCFFLLLAMIYSFGLVLNWKLPNLVNGLEYIFAPVTRLMEQLL